MSAEHIIQELKLEKHPLEGGYFKRTYESPIDINQVDQPKRRLLTSIYYLLTNDQPIGYLHKNKSDILHFHHCGTVVQYLTISPQGELQCHSLGNNLLAGERPQLLVKGGYWKACFLKDGDYALISEAVSPGFDYMDNEIATVQNIQRQFPLLLDEIRQWIKVSNE